MVASATCMLCESPGEFFTKHNYFNGPFCEVAIDAGLHEVDIYRCVQCGSVFSKTHRELPDGKISMLMERGHAVWEKIKNSIYENTIDFPIGTAPHLQEAVFLNVLMKNELVSACDVLDYAAGSGHLSDIVHKYYGLDIVNYEPFAKTAQQKYVLRSELQKYSLVLNCAMFQCLLDISPFMDICGLIKPDGALFLQTMVREEITPEYFAHLFFSPMCANAPTNRGMQILMEKSGFVSSVYSPTAKTWVLFKKEPSGIEEKVAKINSELLSHEIFYKKGFVDYWR